MEKNRKFRRFDVFVFLLFLLNQSLFLLCFALNDEGLALWKFKERVDGDPYGALKSWRNDAGVTDPCSWFGVGCSEGKVVVALDLKDLCLGGTLAPEIRNLIHIKSIILRNNSFTGIIPEGIGELEELEVLDIGYNDFRGPVPSNLGSSHSLAILLLDSNKLQGSLSPEIQLRKILSEIQVDKNQLSGAAKASSGDKRCITRTVANAENAVHGRNLRQTNSLHINSAPPSPRASLSSLFDPWPPMPPSPATVNVTAAPPLNEPIAFPPSAPPPNEPIAPSPSIDGSVSPPSAPAPAPSLNAPQRLNSSSKSNHGKIIGGAIGGTLFIVIAIVGIFIWKTSEATIRPWATGLSGQLQKAFVTGVPSLKRSELEAGCEDFSNVIGNSPIGTLYKGTLSSGVEIAVASVAVTSAKDWSKHLEFQFRKKIEILSKVNHKNFVNLIGYCAEQEPFTRMMVFEYAPNGTLFEHLHIKESEHLDWGMRLRIAMGMAYCLEHMHQLNPPMSHPNLNSSAITLTEDYAAKISDFSFSTEIIATDIEAYGKAPDQPVARPESNVYDFGVLLFEILTGRLPYSVDGYSLEDWASDYLSGSQPLRHIVDPTLDSFQEEKLERIGEVIKTCVHPIPAKRPRMKEITGRLREITGINPDAAIPKLSPLWWAELEILSTEAC